MLKNPKGAGRKPVPYKTKLVQYRVPESEVQKFKIEVSPIINRIRKETTLRETLNEKLDKNTNY